MLETRNENFKYRFLTMEQGFSLVELLVSVAIVGILSGLGVSNFSEYRKNAYNLTALSALGDLRTATLAISDDVRQKRINKAGAVTTANCSQFPSTGVRCYQTNVSLQQTLESLISDKIKQSNKFVYMTASSFMGGDEYSFAFILHCDGDMVFSWHTQIPGLARYMDPGLYALCP